MEQYYSVSQVKWAIEYVRSKGVKFRQIIVDKVGEKEYNNLYGRLRTNAPIPISFLQKMIDVVDTLQDGLDKSLENKSSSDSSLTPDIVSRIESALDYQAKYTSLVESLAAGKTFAEWLERWEAKEGK
jgi:hypothetical protein